MISGLPFLWLDRVCCPPFLVAFADGSLYSLVLWKLV